MDKDTEGILKSLTDQNSNITKTLAEMSEFLTQFKSKMDILHEGVNMNAYIIGYILNEKLRLSKGEINRLVGKAEEDFRRKIKELNEISKIWDLNEIK